MPKRNLSAYLLFSAARQDSGDFKHISVPERAKLIGQEWKALSEDEREVRLPCVARHGVPSLSEY